MRLPLVLLAAVACAPKPAPPQLVPVAHSPVPTDMPVETGPGDQVDAPPAAPAKPDPAPLVPLAPGPGVRVALDVRGWGLVALPDRVVVLDDDFLHLRGFDSTTGAQLWRVQVQAKADGRHTLYAVGERVLLHAGPDLVAVDARTGTLVATHPARAYNGGDSNCRLEVTHGFRDVYRTWVADEPALTACAAVCSCTRRLFRCDSGAPIAEPFNGSELHLHDDLQSEYNIVCLRPPLMVGRIKGRTLLGVQRGRGGRRDDDAYDALALDDAGEELWRRPDLSPAMQRYRDIGGDVGSDTCWSASEENMLVWTCSTGHLKWRAAFAQEPESYTTDVRLAAPGRLLVRRRGEKGLQVELRDLATGKRLWRRELPPDRVGLMPGEQTAILAYANTLTYAWLDLRTGATLHETTLAEHQALTRDPAGDGYLRTGGPELAEFAGDGRLVKTVARDLSKVQWLGARFIVERDNRRASVYHRPDLAVALALEGTWAVEDSTAALGPAGLLLYEHRGATDPLRIVVLRAD